MKKCAIFVTALLLIWQTAWAAVPKAGDPAPGFSLTSVDGQQVSLGDFKGKVVLVGMFHICVPCMNQAMEFEKVRKELGDKVAIIGINTSGDSKEKVVDYLSQFPSQVDFPYLLDPNHTVHQKYVQRDMPTVLVIDSKGVIQARSPGVGADQLIPFIKKLL
ncbi:peroxiredoxin family protein [Nitrospina sp. 32_T5]|uniref:peroxiredoxin family protein n=1 Tax=unclassified Nitrospina TaxID=2638683 RepID=UPI003F9AEEE1